MFLFSALFGIVVIYWLWQANALPLGLWFTSWVEVEKVFARSAAILIAIEITLSGANRFDVITNEFVSRWSGVALFGSAGLCIVIGIFTALSRRANHSDSKEFYHQIVRSVEEDEGS